MLHEMTTGVVCYDGVSDAMFSQLPCRKPGTLVQGTCFIDPDMHIDPLVKGRVDGSGCRAVFYARQPAGIAMRKDMNRIAVFSLADGFDQSQTCFTNLAAVLALPVP